MDPPPPTRQHHPRPSIACAVGGWVVAVASETPIGQRRPVPARGMWLPGRTCCFPWKRRRLHSRLDASRLATCDLFPPKFKSGGDSFKQSRHRQRAEFFTLLPMRMMVKFNSP